MKLILTFIAALLFFSCAPLGERQARKDSVENLKQPILFYAKGQDDNREYYINLRDDNSFDYYERNLGETDYVFYAGTFVREGRDLRLAFHNNRHPKGLSNTGQLNSDQNILTIWGKKKKNDRRMQIQ